MEGGRGTGSTRLLFVHPFLIVFLGGLPELIGLLKRLQPRLHLSPEVVYVRGRDPSPRVYAPPGLALSPFALPRHVNLRARLRRHQLNRRIPGFPLLRHMLKSKKKK